MSYTYTSDLENAWPGKSFAGPKTHTPGSRVKNLGHRFYRPEIGRWASRDPIKAKREFNLYAFCWNSSVMYVDTLGEWPKLLPPHEPPKQLPPHNGAPPKQLPPHKEPPSKPPKCKNKCEFPKLKAWGKAIDSADKLDEVTSWITGGAVVVTFIECNKLYAGCISCTGDPVCSEDSCDKLCNVAKLCFEYAGKAGEAVE